MIMVDTKVTISLRKRLIKLHKLRRLKKAPDYLRERVAKLANVSPDMVRIHQGINDQLMIKVGRRMEDIEAIIRKEATYVEVRPVTVADKNTSGNSGKKADSSAPKVAAKPGKEAKAKKEAASTSK